MCRSWLVLTESVIESKAFQFSLCGLLFVLAVVNDDEDDDD